MQVKKAGEGERGSVNAFQFIFRYRRHRFGG